MLITLAVVGPLIVVFLAVPAYLRRHPEKRGSGSVASGVLGGLDQAFNPSGSDARAELDVEQRHVAPAPTPDGDKGISGGRISIRMPAEHPERTS